MEAFLKTPEYFLQEISSTYWSLQKIINTIMQINHSVMQDKYEERIY